MSSATAQTRVSGSAPGGTALRAAAADVPACTLALPFWLAVAILGAIIGEEGDGGGNVLWEKIGGDWESVQGAEDEVMGAVRALRLY